MLYHGSQNYIKKINKDGLFGEFLFFASSRSDARSHGSVVYTLDEIKLEIADSFDFKQVYNDVIKEAEDKLIAELLLDDLVSEYRELDVFEDEVLEEARDLANQLLCQEAFVHDLYEEYDSDADSMRKADDAWNVQKTIAYAALKLGYDAAELEDEHGSSVAVYMTKNFDNLVLSENSEEDEL